MFSTRYIHDGEGARGDDGVQTLGAVVVINIPEELVQICRPHYAPCVYTMIMMITMIMEQTILCISCVRRSVVLQEQAFCIPIHEAGN